MNPPIRILPFLVALVTFGCSDPTGAAVSEGVVFRADGPAVVLQNHRSAAIVYEVMDASFAARALWVPCARSDCPSVPPDGSVRILKDQIAGSGDSDRVIAYWWHLITGPDGELQPDSIRGLTIEY